MTDKERSKEIKAVVERIRHQDINWLIKQAERVQELEEQLQGILVMYGVRLAKSDKLEQQNKQYREALETVEMVSDFKSEANEIANKALEGEE